MGFTEILTIVFIVLKLFGVITWSWWLVLLPEIFAFAMYVIGAICLLCDISKANKSFKKHFDNFDRW